MADKLSKGMAFGVFDGLHEGHRFFLTEAASRCGTLTVVVAHDEAVKRIKGKVPRRTLLERIEAIRSLDARLKVVPGDEKEGEWSALKTDPPDMVFLGYDQEALAFELKNLGTPFERLSPHRPDVFKSGILDT